MLGFVDAIKRPLKIPPRFVPYMEKHRIYELFYDLATELIIKRPSDHLSYFKQCLDHASRSCDAPRIILLALPTFDKMRLAQSLQKKLGVQIVTLNDLRGPISTVQELAKKVMKILRSGTIYDSGWILVDIPRTRTEALAFQRAGILPTHVIEIKENYVPVNTEYADTTTSCIKASCQNRKSNVNNSEEYLYRKHMRGIREAYANTLIEVEIGDRSIEDLGRDCATLARVRKHCGAPCIFRMALIGCRGSGCRTQAKYLCQRFNLVHVDFNYILEQARLQQTPLSRILRMIEQKWGKRPNPETRIQIVEKYVLGYECMKKGWILTGYPISVEDFKLLDMIDTPPNRVIFVEVDSLICRERITSRRYNMITGSKHVLESEQIYERENTNCQLSIHPKDCMDQVDENIQEYERNVASMMQYAGKTASVIDGNCNENTVRERIEACLIRPAPCAPPRDPGSLSKIKRELNELDLNYESCPDILNEASVSSIYNNKSEEYEGNVTSMMQYAGETICVIDDNCNESTARERIETCLIRPCTASRDTDSLSKIKPELNELDLNYKSCSDIFNEASVSSIYNNFA